MSIIGLILLSVVGLLLVPVTFIFIEILSALRQDSPSEVAKSMGSRPTVAVLIPAHDEEKVIGQAVHAILPQLEPSDRLVVVADNCTDSTADVARRLGATVVERHDPLRPGKGYALEVGALHLESDPRDVVVVIDADCVPEEGAISLLAHATVSTGGPVQGAYLMTAPAGPRESQLREALFLLKNFVRPFGLLHLKLPCLLTGSGMAFPWRLFRKAPLATGNRVDDMQLSVDLAIAGTPPRFCPAASVTGVVPSEPTASRGQRIAWMAGHLRTSIAQVPRLVRAAWRMRRSDLIFLALELSVPPLSVLVLLWFLSSTAAVGLCWHQGFCVPVGAVVYGSAALVAAAIIFWVKFVRERVPIRALLAVPAFFGRSLVAALTMAFGRPKPWVRTSR